MPWNLIRHFSNYSNRSTNFVTDKVNMMPPWKFRINHYTQIFKVFLVRLNFCKYCIYFVESSYTVIVIQIVYVENHFETKWNSYRALSASENIRTSLLQRSFRRPFLHHLHTYIHTYIHMFIDTPFTGLFSHNGLTI